MTKIRKKRVLADRNHKSATSAVKSAERKLTQARRDAAHASVEAQIAEVNARRDEEIAAIRAQYEEEASGFRLQASGAQPDLIASTEMQIETLQRQLAALQGASGIGLQASGQASGFGVGTPTSNSEASVPRFETFPVSGGAPEAPELLVGVPTLKPEAFPSTRIKLPPPVIRSIYAVGTDAVTVNWEPVDDAVSYNVRIAFDPALSDVLKTISAGISQMGMTVRMLEPDTTYWVAMNAVAASPDTSSSFSVAREVKTFAATPPGIVGDLQQWLNVLEAVRQQFFTTLPELHNIDLSPGDRRRAFGSGVRRYGYIDKVSDMAQLYPQFWPAYFDDYGKLKELIREIEALRGLMVYFESGTREILDMLLAAGSEAFQIANKYYRSVRDAARENNPQARSIFRMLRLFWKQRRNGMTGEPTIPEVVRDIKGLMRGTKAGTVAVTNEGNRVTKGERAVVDETQSARKHGGASVTESFDEPDDWDEPDQY